MSLGFTEARGQGSLAAPEKCLGPVLDTRKNLEVCLCVRI